jgi:ribonuclease J
MIQFTQKADLKQIPPSSIIFVNVLKPKRQFFFKPSLLFSFLSTLTILQATSMSSITIFDSAESIGGNKIYVEEGGWGVFLDFGTNFSRTAMFFSDFLQNRTSRRINDALVLGIIPALDIYPKDLKPSDVNTASYQHLNVNAVLLSHAHVDHCGAIGYLDEKTPIVASPTSIAILKGMQDTTLTSTDVIYLGKRVPADETGLRIKSSGEELVGRNFYTTTAPSGKLNEFLSDKPKGPKSRKTLDSVNNLL